PADGGTLARDQGEGPRATQPGGVPRAMLGARNEHGATRPGKGAAMLVQWYVSEVAVCRARNGRSVRYVEAGADSTAGASVEWSSLRPTVATLSATGRTWQLQAGEAAPADAPPEVVAAAASFLAACLQGS